ncbi:MAG: glutamate 5-kinase [Candidatus Moranbacteria bacterium]|nr:glutamate 5-kinase [Candidatus Moranbacteria bacterium]
MYRRIVVKVGTKVLSEKDGLLDAKSVGNIVGQVSALCKKGTEVILVTSGAVGSGRGVIGKRGSGETVEDKQVFAAVGQVRLMETYSRLFRDRGYACAQVLVTKEDFRDRNHYQNMRRCFQNLLRDGIVPVVNENDVIAIKELVFTDNDELAGLIAAQLRADALIILTSVDGILDGNPADQASKTIGRIEADGLSEIRKHITADKTSVGRGGMLSKFAVAKRLVSSGIAVHIANGRKRDVLRDILGGKSVGTTIIPSGKTSGIKRRLAHSEGLAMGAIKVNDCARNILLSKDSAISLLPIGITGIDGDFHAGDVVEIRDRNDSRLGFGVTKFDATQVKDLAGTKGGRAVIHRDYMFIG